MGDTLEDEEEISKVLFELSSNRRASILLKVGQQSLKMQQIAHALDITMTETFRHLQRLSDAKLVEKKVDGAYAITPLGKLAISFLSGFNFILKNSEYFLEHDVFCLPYELVNRLSELSSGDLGKEVLPNLNRVTIIVSDAQEYLWVITDQLDMNTVKITTEKLFKGLKFRLIMQQNLLPTAKAIPGAEQNIARRILATTNIGLLMNEKEAFITFRRVDGRMDYAGFFGTNKVFRKWVGDLFLYYWEKAERWYPDIELNKNAP